jgi:hypothetical protein
MSLIGRVATAAAIVGLMSGCAASLRIGDAGTPGPTCLQAFHGRPEELNGTLVLSAQAVPTAAQVPCLTSLPAGWAFDSFSARRGQSRIALTLGPNREKALVVTLTRDCDVRSATRVRTDRSGARRYEDVQVSAKAYAGDSYYLFPGGCITFEFHINGVGAAPTARMVAGSVRVVDRTALRHYVHLYSRGRFHLDAAPRS